MWCAARGEVRCRSNLVAAGRSNISQASPGTRLLIPVYRMSPCCAPHLRCSLRLCSAGCPAPDRGPAPAPAQTPAQPGHQQHVPAGAAAAGRLQEPPGEGSRAWPEASSSSRGATRCQVQHQQCICAAAAQLASKLQSAAQFAGAVAMPCCSCYCTLIDINTSSVHSCTSVTHASNSAAAAHSPLAVRPPGSWALLPLAPAPASAGCPCPQQPAQQAQAAPQC
jgi:hypothetical protein